MAGDPFAACNGAFRVGGLARVLLAVDLGFSDLGIGGDEGAPCLGAAALSWLRGGQLELSGGTLSANAAGADTEDHVERAWSDPYPDSDLKLSDLSDLVSDRAPGILNVLGLYRVRGEHVSGFGR